VPILKGAGQSLGCLTRPCHFVTEITIGEDEFGENIVP